ncbi:MAG: murein transglycosylase A [Pseudomonadota bacterium]
MRALFAAAITLMALPAAADVDRTLLSFSDLNGWATDDHGAALVAFQESCADLDDPTWQPICTVAFDAPNPRLFFETFFQPVLIEDGEPMLFTGYFEPELRGSRTRKGRYQTPLHAAPDTVGSGTLGPTRQSIDEGALAGQGLELAWIDDPVEAFFLHVQGSGRVRFDDGTTLRLGYGGANGHPYRSIGKEMIRQEILGPHQVSAARIAQWVSENPVQGRELLWHNPSYVFFRVVDHVPSEKGPLGAMNRSLTEMRSIAVDPNFTRLGAPVWIEKGGRDPLNRLMIAQDTGSAIDGAQRADIFFGTGSDAGRAAGQIKDPGRMVVLLPTRQAFAMVGDL